MFQVTDETEVTFSVSMDFAPTIGAARAARHSDDATGRVAHARAAYEDEMLKSMFAMIDDDNSGFLERAEFGTLYRRLQGTASSEDQKAVFDTIDSSGDGKISFQEFREWWLSEDGTTMRGETVSAPALALTESLDSLMPVPR